MLSEKDLRVRSRGVGSSEIAMLIYVDGPSGPKPLSPWGGRHKLWRRKTGQEPWVPPTDLMRRGQYLEAGLLQWYCDDHDYNVARPPTVVHPDYPYVVDSADALVVDDYHNPLRCVECKTTGYMRSDEWGAPGTDQIPMHYITQCQWHLGCHKPRDLVCDVPVDNGRKRIDYVVHWDEELFLALVDTAERFWRDYVVVGKEPPADSAFDTTRWLSRRAQSVSGAGYLDVEPGTDLDTMVAAYRRAAIELKKQELKVEEIKASLMRAIGDRDGVRLQDGRKITWRKSKDSIRLEWHKVAEALSAKVSHDEYAAICRQFESTVPGSRRWVPTSLLKGEEK